MFLCILDQGISAKRADKNRTARCHATNNGAANGRAQSSFLLLFTCLRRNYIAPWTILMSLKCQVVYVLRRVQTVAIFYVFI